MRTTITLESDVEALLKKFMHERDLSFKEAVNLALRTGLAGPRTRADYSFPSADMGEPLVPLEHALQLAASLEDEEVVRKLSSGR
ncbi:MAG: antitoxin [Pseudonocardiales bacterium]|nr:antitoxin [Pseudonocardiales bacterium]